MTLSGLYGQMVQILVRLEDEEMRIWTKTKTKRFKDKNKKNSWISLSFSILWILCSFTFCLSRYSCSNVRSIPFCEAFSHSFCHRKHSLRQLQQLSYHHRQLRSRRIVRKWMISSKEGRKISVSKFYGFFFFLDWTWKKAAYFETPSVSLLLSLCSSSSLSFFTKHLNSDNIENTPGKKVIPHLRKNGRRLRPWSL